MILRACPLGIDCLIVMKYILEFFSYPVETDRACANSVYQILILHMRASGMWLANMLLCSFKYLCKYQYNNIIFTTACRSDETDGVWLHM